MRFILGLRIELVPPLHPLHSRPGAAVEQATQEWPLESPAAIRALCQGPAQAADQGPVQAEPAVLQWTGAATGPPTCVPTPAVQFRTFYGGFSLVSCQ